jgi:hypothetical protein
VSKALDFKEAFNVALPSVFRLNVVVLISCQCNGTAHFENCKQLLEYQNLLLLIEREREIEYNTI